MAKHHLEVYGADISQSAIEITGKRALDLNLNLTLKQSNLLSLNFEDGFFDAVLCVWTTGHGLKEEIRKSVNEMHRVLKKGELLFADFMSTEDGNFGKGTALEAATFLHDFLDHSEFFVSKMAIFSLASAAPSLRFARNRETLFSRP